MRWDICCNLHSIYFFSYSSNFGGAASLSLELLELRAASQKNTMEKIILLSLNHLSFRFSLKLIASLSDLHVRKNFCTVYISVWEASNGICKYIFFRS